MQEQDNQFRVIISENAKQIGGITMTAIKERLIGAITVMSEKDAQKFWHIIQDEFAEHEESWTNIEEVESTDEEVRIVEAYENGDERYQPYMTHEQVKKELGIIE